MFRQLFQTSLLMLALVVSMSCGAQSEPPVPPAEHSVRSHTAVDVEWEDEWDEAFARAVTEGKPVLVNFYAEWCVWCKQLETVTFRDQKVAAMLAENVVPLNIDIDGDVADIVRDHRIQAPPTIVLFSQGGEELGRIPGYLPPSSFLIVVEKILRGEPVRLG